MNKRKSRLYRVPRRATNKKDVFIDPVWLWCCKGDYSQVVVTNDDIPEEQRDKLSVVLDKNYHKIWLPPMVGDEVKYNEQDGSTFTMKITDVQRSYRVDNDKRRGLVPTLMWNVSIEFTEVKWADKKNEEKHES